MIAEQFVTKEGERALVGVEGDADELLRLAVGEGAQQERAGDGEDGGVGSDGECEGKDGNEGEAGIALEHAQAEAEVAEQGGHGVRLQVAGERLLEGQTRNEMAAKRPVTRNL